jgi:hypothetical protein
MADNSTEFMNTEFSRFLQSKGITMYTSVLYMPEQNGVAKQGIRTLTEGVCAMLFASKLTKNLWSVAIKTMT